MLPREGGTDRPTAPPTDDSMLELHRPATKATAPAPAYTLRSLLSGHHRSPPPSSSSSATSSSSPPSPYLARSPGRSLKSLLTTNPFSKLTSRSGSGHEESAASSNNNRQNARQPHNAENEENDVSIDSFEVVQPERGGTNDSTAAQPSSRLQVPPTRTRSRSASLPAPFQPSHELLQSLNAPPSLAAAVGPSSQVTTTATSTSAALVAAATSSMRGLGSESDALERLKMRKYYYRRLADPHTLFDRSYLPGERTLLERTKCIGLSMPNAAICIISGRLVVTNFRVIFDPTSGDDFLKVLLNSYSFVIILINHKSVFVLLISFY